MAIAASVILDRVATTLLDAGLQGWTAAELLDYLNAAQRAICQIKADAFTKVATVSLVAGVDQSLPTDGLAVLRAYRNSASGRAVSQVDQDQLDAHDPTWPAATQNINVRNVVADSRDPRRFLVSPPNTGTGALMMLYGAVPAVITAPAENISLPDTYDTALWAGTLGFAYAKNSREQDIPKSASMFQMMMALATGRTATIKQVAPDIKAIAQAQS